MLNARTNQPSPSYEKIRNMKKTYKNNNDDNKNMKFGHGILHLPQVKCTYNIIGIHLMKTCVTGEENSEYVCLDFHRYICRA